ncbi:PIN domain-containing protein [Paenibacillus rhizovicinus]|uniref:PIN domain-containing protein n=1 Tax=Paenibacillus rhizovicinus TaxID=2704463 RepID=A0A6C0P1U3_9BACL|nr:PIN domain-containing protein [Paenibacillus rhizovicinus]QHW31853.1 PIN domain-containing protein [Paenibacillus rhizovicinus]
MNTISPRIPRVLIDTTNLLSALRVDGHCRNLLRLARLGTIYEPVITNVCLWELYRNACGKGIKGYVYTYDEVEEFLTAFVYPLLGRDGAVNGLIGRHDIELAIRANRPLGETLVTITGCSEEQALHIITGNGMELPLEKYDAQDFHVWASAVEQHVDAILTANTKRFPSQIGNIQRVDPRDFYTYLGI